jgi:hypothetical protein
MKDFRFNKKAQSILEYVIILTVILAAILLGTKYIKNSLLGKDVTDSSQVSDTSLFGQAGGVITDHTSELANIGQPKEK